MLTIAIHIPFARKGERTTKQELTNGKKNTASGRLLVPTTWEGDYKFVRTVEVDHDENEKGYYGTVCHDKTPEHRVCDGSVVTPQSVDSQRNHHYR